MAAWKPGQSGNPSGRPAGALNRKTLVAAALDAASEDVTKAVIAAAKGGDMQAARLCLERVQPPLRPRAEKVQFALDSASPLTAQAQQILSAVAAGELDPETGKLLVDCLHGFTALRQADELAARIEALEAAALDAQQAIAPGGVLRTST
jgi:hypothetical protein